MLLSQLARIRTRSWLAGPSAYGLSREASASAWLCSQLRFVISLPVDSACWLNTDSCCCRIEAAFYLLGGGWEPLSCWRPPSGPPVMEPSRVCSHGRHGAGSLVSPMCMCWVALAVLDSVWLYGQAPLSMGFSRQEYWSGLTFPTPGNLPDPGIKPVSLMSPGLAGGFFTTSTT